MSSSDDKLSQVVSIAGCSPSQAQFYLDSANGDVATAVATYFENQGNDPTSTLDDNHAQDDDVEFEQAQPLQGANLFGGGGRETSQRPTASSSTSASGAYTLSGQPAEPRPAGWGAASGGSSSSSSRAASTNRNPLRSNTGPRVTGFRDLAASSGGPSVGGFGGFGGAGGGDDSDDDDEGKDPSNFYTGGAKSGLSVENPDDQRRGGAHGDMIRNILQQAREGAKNLGGAFGGGGASSSSGGASTSSAFTGSAHTLGSDETPSSFIPDPTKRDGDDQDEEEEEEEVATRTLTFWQDGFSVEDGELLKYEDNQDLLAAIQSGRAPLSLLKVRHDQPVELRIAKRMNEKWQRQPPPPAGPFAGHGNRLGSVSPFPDPSTSSSSTTSNLTTMPGSFAAANPTTSSSTPSRGGAGGAGAGAGAGGGGPISTEVKFEVDRTAPTTQLQIRLRQGERMVATFNHSHTVGDIRRYINASRPGEASSPYALQTTFPSKDLTDDSVSLKDAGLLGSVVVQRGL
ncbi:hypothetical protein JCM10212_002338 [Sporobolomyces blumeae]